MGLLVWAQAGRIAEKVKWFGWRPEALNWEKSDRASKGWRLWEKWVMREVQVTMVLCWAIEKRVRLSLTWPHLASMLMRLFWIKGREI